MINISMPDVARLRAFWKREPQVATFVLGNAMDDAVLLLQREISDAMPVGASGQLRNSWFSDVKSLSGQVVGLVGSPLEYAEAVELGTKPHFPPVQELQDWVEAKLGLQGSEARSVAFLIARKISKVGTKAQYTVRDQLNQHKAQIDTLFQRAVAQMFEQMGAT